MSGLFCNAVLLHGSFHSAQFGRQVIVRREVIDFIMVGLDAPS